MGDKAKKVFKPRPKDLIGTISPTYGTYSSIKRTKEGIAAAEEAFDVPEPPGPTDAERALQGRQREELAKLDDEENTRIKRGLRGQLGARRLLSSVRTRVSSSKVGSGASMSGGGSSGGGTGAGGGGGGGGSGGPGGGRRPSVLTR